MESNHYAAFKQFMYTHVFPYHQPLCFLLLRHGCGILHKWAEDLSVCGVYDGKKDIDNTMQVFIHQSKKSPSLSRPGFVPMLDVLTGHYNAPC